MFIPIVIVSCMVLVGVVGFVWQRTRGRALLRELAAQQAAGPAAVRAWIDRTTPPSAVAARKTAWPLRQRWCALALSGDLATVDAELAALGGDAFAWRLVAEVGAQVGRAARGDAATAAAAAARLRELAGRVRTELRGQVRTIHLQVLDALAPWADALAGTAPPPAAMVGLQRATAYQPLLRALVWEGMVKACERAGDPRATWMREALARHALEI